MDLRETGINVANWIPLAQDRVQWRAFVNTVMNLRVPYGKGEVALCLTKHHAMKTYCGVEVQYHAFLTYALDGGVCSASRPGRFTPQGKRS
jgi:hypothetical protein